MKPSVEVVGMVKPYLGADGIMKLFVGVNRIRSNILQEQVELVKVFATVGRIGLI